MLLLFQQEFSDTNIIVVQHNLNQEVESRIIDDTNTINNNLVDRIEFDIIDPYNKLTIYLKSTASGRVQLLKPESVIVTTQDKLNIHEIEGIGNRTRNSLSTGILTGGEISINGSDNTKFDIAAGSGFVINNYTDPLNPTETYVEWTIKTALVDSYLSTSDETTIAIDKDGYVIQTGDYFSDEERRDLIILGTTGHLGRTEIEYVIVEPIVVFDVLNQVGDFFENFGAFNISGNIFEPNGSNLYMNKTAGKTFDMGTNYVNSKKSPNIFNSSAYIAPYLQYYNRDSYGEWVTGSYSQSVITNKYDSGTGLVDVPSGKWTIQTLFLYAPTETIDIQFGQKYYDSSESAEGAIQELIDVNPFLSYDTFRGWLVVKENATELNDLNQAKFIVVIGLGTFYMAAGSGLSISKTTASNIGTSGIGFYDSKEEVDLRFRNLNCTNNKISVTLNDGYHTVDLDVIEGYLSHQSLSGSGTNTHSQIDSHIGNTSNPHSVTATQVGNTIAQWNADKLEGYAIATTGPTDGQVLAWDSSISKYKPVTGGKHGKEIIVALSGGDFTSVKSAIDSITDASITNPYVIKVMPGVYNEDPFTIKSFISVVGQGDPYWGVSLVTTNNSAHFITGSYASELKDISVTGPSGAGYATINYETTSVIPFTLDNILIRKGYYGVWCHPSGYGNVTAFKIVPTYIGSTMNKFMYVSGMGTLSCFECACVGLPPYTISYGYVADGSGAQITLDLSSFSVIGGVGIFIDNVARARLNACVFSNGSNAIYVGSDGGIVSASGCTISGNFTYDIISNTPNCTIQYNGVARKNKISVPEGSGFSASFVDSTIGEEGQVVLGELWFGTPEYSFALGSYSKNEACSSLLTGGDLTVSSGLELSVLEGYGYINDGTKVYDVSWADSYLTLTVNKEQLWVVVENDGYITETFSAPDEKQVIVLGTATTGSDVIYFLSERSVFLKQYLANAHIYYRDVIGPISVSGCTVTKHETTSLQMDVDSGIFYIFDNRKESSASSPITFTYWYRKSGGGWNKVTDRTEIDSDHYDDGSGTLQNIPLFSYKGDLLYVTTDGDLTTYHCIYSQETALTSGGVTNNPIPPDVLNSNALRIARIVVQRGSSNITSISDQRPKLGQLSSGSTSITRHSDLSGLSADDHTQYQLRTEKNSASGYCGLNASTKVDYTYLPFTSTPPSTISVTTALTGTSNQICYSDHVHGVSTAVASDLVVGGSSSGGSASSLIRSDHLHALPAFGTSSGTFCQGNDSRLSDDRTASGLRTATTVVSISSSAAPTVGQILKATSSTNAIWQEEDFPPLSDIAPNDVSKTTASAGIDGYASRRDHQHSISVGSPVSVGTSNSDGSATSLSRSDHVHAGLKRDANDFSTFTSKSTLVSGDIILIEDSAASGVKKYTTYSSFHGDFSNGGDTAVAARSLGNNSAYDLYLRTNSTNVLQITSAGSVKVLGTTGEAGVLYSEKYIMGRGPDLSCIPVVDGQSVITTWWGMQLIGNKQSNVNYTPSNYGLRNDFSVIIPNQQAASIGLVVQGQTGQTGDLINWRNSSSTVLSKVTANGYIVAPNINNCRRARVATTIEITLSGTQTIDGVSVVAGDLVLVKNQGTGSQNGIYVCDAGAWVYASDWQTGFVFTETYVSVSEGTTNGHTTWRVNNTGTITVGSTAIVFTRIFMSRDAGDINSFTDKTTLSYSDVLLIEDSADTYNKKKVTVGNFPKRWPFSKVLTVDATDPDADYSTIQAAINAASAGMTILINPGSYAETISLKDGVDLFGVGGSGIGYPNTTTNGVWISRVMDTTTDLVTLSSGSCSLTNIGIKLDRGTANGITLRALVCSGTKLQLNNCHVEINGSAFPNTCSFVTIQATAGELSLINCNIVSAAEYVSQTLDYGLYISGACTTNLNNSRFTPDVSTTSQSNIYINNASAVVNMNGCYVQGDCVRTLGTLNLYGGNQMDYGVSSDPIDGTGAGFKQWDAVRIDGSNEQYKLNLKTVTGDVGSPANGDIWYNDTTGKFRGRENGSTYDLISSTSVFGGGYTFAESLARSTTTSSTYQTKVTLTTPSTSGTYMVMFSCVLDMASSNIIGLCRLYNNTDDDVLYEANIRPSSSSVDWSISGFSQITISGSAKTLYVQYRSSVAGTTTGISYARAQIWRVA